MIAVSSAYRWLSVLAVPRVGVGLGQREPALELGVLAEQALDGLEHRVAPSRSVAGTGRST